MAISETARNNHDDPFHGRVSTLKVTDQELIEVFDNFAFDEVLRHSSLDTRTRLMVQLAALIGARALSEYRIMLGAALTAGVTPFEAREIVYQAVPYTGMGTAFDFIHATNEVLTERGIQLPLHFPAVPVGQLLRRPPNPHRNRRARTRAADLRHARRLGGCDSQVKGHVAANLNVGNSRQDLIDVITVLLPFIGHPRILNALAAVNDIAPALQVGQ